MPNYNLYDRVVGKTLSLVIETATNKSGIVINNYIDDDCTHYFIEIAKMASHICKCQLYIRMSLVEFIKFRLKNRKGTKKIKRYTPKKYSKDLGFVPTYNIATKIRKEFEFFNNRIFEDIYKEYYKVQKKK